MAGEYQLAEKVLESGLDSARENDGMDETVLARAMMYQVIEHYKKTRDENDIIGELEQYLRGFEDEGEPVITRGC